METHLGLRKPISRLAASAAIVLLCVTLVGGCAEDTTTVAAPPKGSLSVSVNGLPAQTDAGIAIVGPDGYTAAVNDDQTLSGLDPGVYTVAAGTVQNGSLLFTPDQANQQVSVVASETANADVTYSSSLAFGQLIVGVDGLPAQTNASISVSGPGGFQRSVTATDTLRDLAAGDYTISAQPVDVGADSYAPTPTNEVATIIGGGTGAVFMTYSLVATGALDLSIVGFEITQATQTVDNQVPMIAGRSAWLRIYGVADIAPKDMPEIRVEIYNGEQLVHSENLTASAATMPQTRDRSSLANSYNLELPALWVQDGLSIRATIDPSAQIAESDESNNRFPVDGSKSAIQVVTAASLPMRLVPIHQSVNGLTGDVNASNAVGYVSDAAAIFPVPSVDVDVRSTYTTDLGALAANGTNWSQLLKEIQVLKQADASDAVYYGVAQVEYNSGVAGLGYIPASRSVDWNVAIGWDRTNSRASVLAHELGHNLGRRHAPCGNPANPDAAYPYPNAWIGQWGLDSRDGQLVDPETHHDIMSYCGPQWISDYQYENVLNFLGIASRSFTTERTNCLVVWGQVNADGEVILDPSFVIEARPLMPDRGGEFEVRADDADGQRLVNFSFSPPEIGCGEEFDERGFVWLVPISDAQAQSVHSVRVRGSRGETIREAKASTMASDGSAVAGRRQLWQLDRIGPRRAKLEWDTASLPLAIVRDPRNDELLAIARHGDLEFECLIDEVELLFSDGVQTTSATSGLD